MSCSVKGCKNAKRFYPEGVYFFTFPLVKEVLDEWLTVLNIDKTSWQYSKNKFVCSVHFEASDLVWGKRKTPSLHTEAVPSLNLVKPEPLVVDEVLYIESQTETTCRTCLEALDEKDVITVVDVHPNFDIIIKNMIIKCVPKMESTLSETDRICDNCLAFLSSAYSFITTCESTEQKLQTVEKGIVIEVVKDESDCEEDKSSINKDHCYSSAVKAIMKSKEGLNENLVRPKKFYECPNCKKIYWQILNLKKHVPKCVKRKNPVIYYEGNSMKICKDCNELFKTVNDLRKHTTESHDCTLRCLVCLKKFANSEDFEKHKTVHYKFECKICNTNFATKRECLVHKKRTHKDNIAHAKELHLNYMCEKCGKSFLNASALSTHKRVHMEGNLGLCPICGKSFTDYHLNAHMKIHSRTSTHKCKTCDKNFSNSRYLKRHEILHSIEKDFKCHLCPKAFRRKYYLQMHLNCFHKLGEKYVCDVCNREFYRLDRFKSHVQKHQEKVGFRKRSYNFKPKIDVANHTQLPPKRKTRDNQPAYLINEETENIEEYTINIDETVVDNEYVILASIDDILTEREVT